MAIITNQAIQVLTTLEYLGNYDGIPYFGLVLQTGVGQMQGGTLTIDSSIQNILEPWMWWDPANATKPTSVQPPQIQLWQATPNTPTGVPLKDANGKDIKTEVLPLPSSANGHQLSVDPSIIEQLGADCKAALDPTNGAPYLDWSDPTPNGSGPASARRDGKSILPWPAHLAQVTRYPYPIPHLLNLCFFIKAPGFDAAKVSDAKTYFFATINFNAEVDLKTVNYARPDPKTFRAPDANSRLVIPLINPDDATDNSVAVTTQPLTLPITSAAQVVAANSTAYTAETADWQAHLSSSVASTFDLSARLVDTVRQACDRSNGTNSDPGAVGLRNAVAAQFTGFVTAVLTAQREIVAYGCQSGPNGKSLLDRLLDAWVAESKDPKNRTFATTLSTKVNTQRASDTSNNVASFDTWLALLKGSPVFATDPLLPPSPAGSNATVFDGTKKGNANTDPAYKKGDTVIFHGRSYIATSDVPSPPIGGPTNAIDAGHWRCSTPLLPFYDSSKAYQAGDRVLYADTVYQFSPVKPPVQAAPPGGNWQSVSPFTPNVDPTNLPDRLIAVEHLQLQFTQPDLLSQILLAQWKSVFHAPSSSWSTAENAQFQSFLSSASANLTVWDVRGLLLQCHLGKSWTNIVRSPASRDSVRSAIQTQFDTRLDELLNQLPTAPGTTPTFAALLKGSVAAWVGSRINLLVPAPTSAPSQPTRSAQGLSVMLGTLDANGAKANDQFDTLRSIAGYCVLMRQAGGSDWRCLNAGIPVASVNPPADATKPTFAIHDPDKKPDALPDPVVIPVPMHNQDGLRRAILTYDNQPLMCSSPAHAFGDGLVPTPKPDSARPFDRMISFQHLSVVKDLKDDTQWKIPGLAFQQSYEFLLGSVSNAGALPPEFADPKNPGVFKFDSVKTTAPAATITDVPYLRTVPVGDLRFASDYSNPKGGKPKSARLAGGVSFDKLNLPPIPPDVQPRASEIYRSSLAPVQLDGQTQPQPVVGIPPEKPSKPLIVLSPYDTPDQVSEFDLSIRKPTIDFITWDRTQAAIAGTHQARQWAWQLFNTNARKQNSNFDLSLEDPAIDSLTISVIDEADKQEKSFGPIQWKDAVIPDPATNPKALQANSDSVLLKICTDTAYTAIDLSAPASGAPLVYTLKLPPGCLRKVKLTVNPKAGSKAQFAPGISSAPSPYELLVETASSAFPQQDELQKFFSVQPPSKAADPVTFTLDLQPDPAWNQISRVDLQAQLWRWDGRPARRFPFDKVVAPDVPQPVADLLLWELETFTTRTASDSTTRPMVRRTNEFVANEDRGTELGATYYRAGIIAYNRYGSLVPETIIAPDKSVLQVRSAASLNSFASIPGADGAWVRRFIPGRYTLDGTKPKSYKPPKPAIKYIVPLTSAYGGSRQAASSVLVVVQGPWFAIAGLAEDISVKILTSDKQNHPNEFKEAGPDPIYYRNSADHPLPTSYAEYSSPFTAPEKGPRFHGPVGHTFDSSDANPLWVTSSFVLDPPQEYADSTKPGDPPISIPATQEGTFALIQFARIIDCEGMAVADANRKLTRDTPQSALDRSRSSDLTDPVWVQFLPSRFLPVDDKTDFDTLVVKRDKAAVGIYDPKGQLIQLTHDLHPEPTNPSDYRFALLITEKVADLLGRPGQERYVDMLLQAPSKSKIAQWTYDPAKSGINPDPKAQTLIARIVVIQRQVNTSKLCKAPSAVLPPNPLPCAYSDVSDADGFWNEMFPSDPSQDATSRIVAISPPIPSYNPMDLPQSCKLDTTLNSLPPAGQGD